MGIALRISRPNGRFQQWHALLWNPNKPQRAGEFLVQGVRPISLAVELGWSGAHVDIRRPTATVALGGRDAGSGRRWPRGLRSGAAPGLGGKAEDVPELVAVVGMPRDELSRTPVGPSLLGAVFDRPSSPGNIGTMLRSLDAFGGAGLIVTGRAADPYDPKSVRASTGSLMAVPVVRTRSQASLVGGATVEPDGFTVVVQARTLGAM